ncbi:MAG TPA: ATP-binding protein [Candidatus Acidoferrum sp.]|nr:ATP-binding protein [Candidatus Acidoferrum sp.]
MNALTYIRLVGFTAGTLLMLFWMVVILGYRRQRNFERVFFFLCLALFLFYAGSLLALNAQIYYALPPHNLTTFAALLIGTGLALVPALLFHLHWEFAETRDFHPRKKFKWPILLFAYAPVVYFLGMALPTRLRSQNFDFGIPGNSLGLGFVIWFVFIAGVSCEWERQFAQEMKGRPERTFHRLAWAAMVFATAFLIAIHLAIPSLSRSGREILATAISLLGLFPFVALIYFVQRHNFLNIGRQKNLLYAVSATFVALLYLALVRRIGEWFAPVLPPEATAAVLLFVLVVFIEPLQRLLGRRLRETAQRELDRVQRLMTRIQQEARQGNQAELAKYIEQTTRQELELESTTLKFVGAAAEVRPRSVEQTELDPARSRWATELVFPLRRNGDVFAYLQVKAHGSAISGETMAALESLSEQLPSALDLCRLIEEKVQLERELAERERLALVGQTAASISHNLKNPLGSIKTILQVQLENPEMPESMRGETKMVLEEINRLSSKLNQLLQFSRPAFAGSGEDAKCDMREVVRNVLEVLRPEGEKRGVRLGSRIVEGDSIVEASVEAIHDIVSNLVVNAIDASRAGGEVKVQVSWLGLPCSVSVEDEGPGIPEDLQEKILEPFFTTKAQGTGLGLAIVAKRVAELCGELKVASPIKDGRGSRFEVKIWPAAMRRTRGLSKSAE